MSSAAQAVGVRLADLWTASGDGRPGLPSTQELVEVVAREALVVLVAAQELQHGEALAPADIDRLVRANDRIAVAMAALS